MKLTDYWKMAIAVLLACALPIPAQAELITFAFSGTIFEVRDDDGFLGGAVAPGDGFSGRYTFEATTPDYRPNNPTFGGYAEAVTQIAGYVASVPFDQSDDMAIGIFVADDFSTPPRDSYEVESGVNLAGEVWHLEIDLQDWDATALDTDALPLNPPDPSAFDSATFDLYLESENVQIRGSLDQLVPEPQSVIIVLLGTLQLLARRPRTNRKRLCM